MLISQTTEMHGIPMTTNKPYFPLITNSPQNLQITQRQQSAVKRETAGTSKMDMS